MPYEFHVSSKAFGLINEPEANLRTVPIGVEAQKCHAQYATLSKRNSKVPPRIDPHIETLLQGGYHYINICRVALV